MWKWHVFAFRILRGGDRLPIYRLLQEAAFDAEAERVMTTAYEAALALARLNDRQDPLTELLAKKIVDTYRNGEHDPHRLCDKTLKELRVSFEN